MSSIDEHLGNINSLFKTTSRDSSPERWVDSKPSYGKVTGTLLIDFALKQ